MKNRIKGTSFIRSDNEIVLRLENPIPAIGYDAKEIRKMLKATIVPIKKKFPRTTEEARTFVADWRDFEAHGHTIDDVYIFLSYYEK